MSIRLSCKKSLTIPKLFSKKPVQHIRVEDCENAYSNTVLIGNWFEKRFTHENDRKAITPAIYGISDCIADISVYRSDFKQPITVASGEDHLDFIQWKQQGFHNRLISEETNIKLWDGDQFVNNGTTLKDIMYRIIPKENVECSILRPTKRKFSNDYMQSFGNSTHTGLLNWRKYEQMKEFNTPIDVSHYKSTFKPLRFEQQILHYKRPQRKTNI